MSKAIRFKGKPIEVEPKKTSGGAASVSNDKNESPTWTEDDGHSAHKQLLDDFEAMDDILRQEINEKREEEEKNKKLFQKWDEEDKEEENLFKNIKKMCEIVKKMNERDAGFLDKRMTNSRQMLSYLL